MGLYAGFARVDITPPFGGVPLGGYGTSERRLASVVLDPIYVNAIAYGEGERVGAVCLTVDMEGIPDPWTSVYREKISEATGLDQSVVLIGVTHTHSAPDIYSELDSIKVFREEFLPERLIEAAKRAIADLKPAKIYYGKMEVGHPGARLNFNRHYYMIPKEETGHPDPEHYIWVGDAFGFPDHEHYVYGGHEEEPDYDISVVKLERDAADDVLLVSFAAHAHITGGLTKPFLSSDFPGATVQEIEKLIPGTKCCFLQGCAGNVNPHTRIGSEGVIGLTTGKNRNHHAYAAVLAGHVELMIRKGEFYPSESDRFEIIQENYTARRNHSTDYLVERARKIYDYYLQVGYTDEIREICKKEGFNTPYQCRSIILRSESPATGEIELHALRLGDVAVVTAPNELFSATGKHIKERSPFKMTIVKPYSCGALSYLPSKGTCENSYEWNITKFEPGTAEELETEFGRMLEKIYHL